MLLSLSSDDNKQKKFNIDILYKTF